MIFRITPDKTPTRKIGLIKVRNFTQDLAALFEAPDLSLLLKYHSRKAPISRLSKIRVRNNMIRGVTFFNVCH